MNETQPSRRVISLTLPNDMLAQIDRLCAAEDRDRSKQVERLLRDALGRKETKAK